MYFLSAVVPGTDRVYIPPVIRIHRRWRYKAILPMNLNLNLNLFLPRVQLFRQTGMRRRTCSKVHRKSIARHRLNDLEIHVPCEPQSVTRNLHASRIHATWCSRSQSFSRRHRLSHTLEACGCQSMKGLRLQPICGQHWSKHNQILFLLL